MERETEGDAISSFKPGPGLYTRPMSSTTCLDLPSTHPIWQPSHQSMVALVVNQINRVPLMPTWPLHTTHMGNHRQMPNCCCAASYAYRQKDRLQWMSQVSREVAEITPSRLCAAGGILSNNPMSKPVKANTVKMNHNQLHRPPDRDTSNIETMLTPSIRIKRLKGWSKLFMRILPFRLARV